MRRVKMAVFAGLLTLLWFAPAQAAPSWFVVKVSAAGSAITGQLSIRLSDTASTPAFTNKWFFVLVTGVELNTKEILAVALTAVSLDSEVFIFADPDLAVPDITNMYVCNPKC